MAQTASAIISRAEANGSLAHVVELVPASRLDTGTISQDVIDDWTTIRTKLASIRTELGLPAHDDDAAG